MSISVPSKTEYTGNKRPSNWEIFCIILLFFIWSAQHSVCYYLYRYLWRQFSPLYSFVQCDKYHYRNYATTINNRNNNNCGKTSNNKIGEHTYRETMIRERLYAVSCHIFRLGWHGIYVNVRADFFFVSEIQEKIQRASQWLRELA